MPFILIAPNAFKGSLTALQAARALRAGVHSILPKARTKLIPISDGGDGLIDALITARAGTLIPVAVRGPLGERRRSTFGWIKGRTAVVEMARASGLALVPRRRRDPLKATSYGTGQLIDAALKARAKVIIIGLGGSATNDGGAGMAQALGCRLLDASGRPIGLGAAQLLKLKRIEPGALKSRLSGVRVIGVCDVSNPLIGPRGSARVYGPQKGATPKMVAILEKALRRYAQVLKRDCRADVARKPGSGAAGGLGAGLLAFLNAELVAGANYVLKEIGIALSLSRAGAVFTGEGRLDSTSFYGKAPVELARLARLMGVPAACVCGEIDPGVRSRLAGAGIGAAVALAEVGAKPSDSIAKARLWVEKAGALAVRRLLLAGAILGFFGSSVRAADFAEIDRLYFHRHDTGNLERCLSKIEAALAQNPNDAELLWRQGRGLVRLGERQNKKEKIAAFKRAETLLRRAVELNPQNAEAHFFLGIAMGRRGQARGVLKSLFLVGPLRREMETVLKLDPHHGGAHRVLGEMYMQLPGLAGGSKTKAVGELEQAVKLEPNGMAHYAPLAEAYLAVGNKDKAIAVLNRGLTIKEPADPSEYAGNRKKIGEMLKDLGPQ